MAVHAKIARAFEQGFEVPDGNGDVRVDSYPAVEVVYVTDEGVEVHKVAYAIRKGTPIQTMDDVLAVTEREVARYEKALAKPPKDETPPDPAVVSAKVAEWDAKRGEPIDKLVEGGEAAQKPGKP